MKIKEILEIAEGIAKQKDKKEFLLENVTEDLKNILQMNYDDKIVFDLPSGAPTVDNNQAVSVRKLSNVLKAVPRLLTSSKGSRPRKELLFEKIFMLQLDSSDREVLVDAKDKQIHVKYPSLTPKFIKSIWPEIVSPITK